MAHNHTPSQGHLFDRRMVGRILKAEWGQDISIEDDDATTRCVRRFGRLKRGPKERKSQTHVTGARMADSNGHDVSTGLPIYPRDV